MQWTQDALVGFDGEKLDLTQVRLIETRLLVHQESGWQALPYVWNNAVKRLSTMHFRARQ